MNKTSLLDKNKLNSMKWFHSIDLGEYATSGRFKRGEPQNSSLYGFMDLVKDIDLKGAKVLDIGATDGLASFGMKALGASEVHATESYEKDTFKLLNQLLGSEINYHPNTQVKDLASLFSPASFDLILCAGVFYHMLNPVSAFTECRKLLKTGGLLFMETPYLAKETKALLMLNSEEKVVNEVYTYFVPSKPVLEGLMKLTGFQILAIRTKSNQDRITLLGRAVPVAQIPNRGPMLKRIHEVDFCDREFQLRKHTQSPVLSQIRYKGEGGDRHIDHNTYEPDFPYHPHRDKPVVGSTLWASETGNH